MEDALLPDWCLAGGFLTCFSLGCWCVPCGRRMTCSLGAKSLNPAVHVHSSPLPWTVAAADFPIQSFTFAKWLFDRNRLLFEESPPLHDGLVVYQSLKQYEILVNSVLCLMVQIPICHLFSHLVMQSLLEALHDSQGCKENQSKANMSLLWLGSLIWGRTESWFLLVSLRTYFKWK